MEPPHETSDSLRDRRRAERHRRRRREAQRQGLFYAFCIAALGAVYWYAQGEVAPNSSRTMDTRMLLEEAQRTMLRESVQARVEPLADRDRRGLARQRQWVAALALRHVGAAPRGGDLDDLRILQTLIDERVLAIDQQYEQQALGVVLGDVMAEQLELSWVIVDDEYGRSRALQYGSQEDLFFPVTMISKRYEQRIPVDVEELYRKIEVEVERVGRLRGR